jgi:hypothetical protein
MPFSPRFDKVQTAGSVKVSGKTILITELVVKSWDGLNFTRNPVSDCTTVVIDGMTERFCNSPDIIFYRTILSYFVAISSPF